MEVATAEHTSPEMAKLILEVEDAAYKDRKEYQEWEKDVKRIRNENLVLQRMISEGNTNVELIPVPEEPVMFHTNGVRRRIRYRLFRIRDGGNVAFEHDKGLKAWIELQFRPGMFWNTFTFEWDVSPSAPLKVISQFEWFSEGGEVDRETGLLKPTGFTKQE